MPYINGMNISNKEVTLSGNNGTVVTNNLESYRTGKRTTAANTGTRAVSYTHLDVYKRQP